MTLQKAKTDNSALYELLRNIDLTMEKYKIDPGDKEESETVQDITIKWYQNFMKLNFPQLSSSSDKNPGLSRDLKFITTTPFISFGKCQIKGIFKLTL